jgi:hypothetical protein
MEFSWKKNLTKAALAALVAGGSASAVVIADALDKGEVDLRKVAISAGLTFAAAAFESLRNFLKNTHL